MRWCQSRTGFRSSGSTGALSTKEARSAASITAPIERMNGLPDALATARCRLRSASAKAAEELGSRVIRSPLGRQRRRARLHRKANLGEIAEEALIDTGVEMPGQHVGVEHVPGTALPYQGADPGLGRE